MFFLYLNGNEPSYLTTIKQWQMKTSQISTQLSKAQTDAMFEDDSQIYQEILHERDRLRNELNKISNEIENLKMRLSQVRHQNRELPKRCHVDVQITPNEFRQFNSSYGFNVGQYISNKKFN